MSRKTAWSQSGSSFPSDRIKPANSHSQPPTKRKGKGAHESNEKPKSKDVVQLESLLKRLREHTGRDKDPNGGCYCLAREHALSPYAPICRSCGLILCTINPPYSACPHCGTGLLANASMRDALIARVETQIDETLRREAEEKQLVEEEARRAAGAFPTLSAPPTSTTTATTNLSTPSSSSMLRPSTNEPRKVLSLNSKTKKVTVSAFVSTPAVSRPASRSSIENVEEEITRVPPPPAEVTYARRIPDANRPWMNLLISDEVLYVPPPNTASVSQCNQGDGKKRRKNKPNHASSTSTAGS